MHPILGDAYWFWQHPAVTILGLLLVGGVAGIALLLAACYPGYRRSRRHGRETR